MRKAPEVALRSLRHCLRASLPWVARRRRERRRSRPRQTAPRRDNETLDHLLSCWLRVAGTMYRTPRALRKSGLDASRLRRKYLRVTGRIVLEGAEHLVAALLVEAEGLVAVGLQVGSRSSHDSIAKASAASISATRAAGRAPPRPPRGTVTCIQPPQASPSQPAQPFALAVLQEEADRVPCVDAGARDVECRQVVR